ncbi:hypothetical protein H0H93_016510 [Arthromyces matolae]|nr:hypothetical protein H0H93_016510 [Arthromyces matolae]
MASSYASSFPKFDPEVLGACEAFWRDHYTFLKGRGYTLRDRYNPDWIPSWKNAKKGQKRKECEDGQVLTVRIEVIEEGMVLLTDAFIKYGNVADAVCPDGSLVVLKEIKITKSVHEIEVGRLFSSEPLSKNPKNHCVPILKVIDLPAGSQSVLIVMPYLLESKYPPFVTIGELVEHFRQIFEVNAPSQMLIALRSNAMKGLEFMHANNVVHGDCKLDNFMADTLSLYHAPPHPSTPRMRRDWRGPATIRNSRTRQPVKYYLIDFGLSRIYRTEDDPPLREPVWGGDQSVPEFALPDVLLCDPFAVDGWEDMAMPKQGLEFMKPLLRDMTASDPKKRPAMAEVVKRFDEILKGVDDTTLRSPVLNVGQKMKFRKSVAHWTVQWLYKLLLIPAIPRM